MRIDINVTCPQCEKERGVKVWLGDYPEAVPFCGCTLSSNDIDLAIEAAEHEREYGWSDYDPHSQEEAQP